MASTPDTGETKAPAALAVNPPADPPPIPVPGEGKHRGLADTVRRHLKDGNQLADFSEHDPVMDALEDVVSGIKTGKGIKNHAEIERLIANQEERNKIIENLLMTRDYSRLVFYMKAEDVLERFLLDCVGRKDLKGSEALELFKIVTSKKEEISRSVKAGASTITDIMSMVNKVDWKVTMAEKDIEKQFENTTPQGREIVRRLGYRLVKLAKSAKSQDKKGST